MTDQYQRTVPRLKALTEESLEVHFHRVLCRYLQGLTWIGN